MVPAQLAQNNNIKVAFKDGETAVYAVASDSVLQFAFDEAAVVFDQRGDNLVLTNADDNVIIVENYIALAKAGTPPQVLLENGILVAGDVFLFSVEQQDTAANAALPGSGFNEFFTDPGMLVETPQAADDPVVNAPQVGLIDEQPVFEVLDNPELLAAATIVADATDAGGGETGGETGYQYPLVAENGEVDGPGPDYAMDHDLSLDLQSFFEAPIDDPDDWFLVADINEDSYLSGGAGNDLIRGVSGNDTLIGNDGNDVLIGLSNNDLLYGGSGNDQIIGGSGSDTIYGGGGYDTITLGDSRFWINDTSNDVLVFNGETFADGSAIVEVTDFTIGEDGIKLEDGVVIEALLDVPGVGADEGYIEFVLDNGTEDNVIVRLEGTSRAEFDAHIDGLGDSYAYSDTEQLLQYMAGNETNWV